LAYDLGNGELFFAGESAFSQDFHSRPQISLPL
jgi:hypothetical protein